MRRRSFLKGVGVAGVAMSAPGIILPAWSRETVKVGCLFSSSGAMANIEGRLNYVVQMAAQEINRDGGVLGRQIEVVTTDPASNWPLYGQQGRQLLEEERVSAMFGCWTSASRKAVLPVVEQNDGLLYYPLHFEGEENSKNVVYMNSPPASSVLPAIEYLMGDNGGRARRFFMLGSDYVWPRTINAQLKGYWKKEWGIEPSAWQEEYVPVGHSDFQSLVNQIKRFADEDGEQPIVVLTVVGNSIPNFFQEYINQGLSALDVPVLGLDVVEADLEGLDTEQLVGHLNCWAYLQNAKSEENTRFLNSWSDYVVQNNVPFRKDVAIDPMVSAYNSVYMWAQAAEKAGSFDVPEVRNAFPGTSIACPSGYEIKLTEENNYVHRGVFIGSVNRNQGFDIVWQSPETTTPAPYSIYL
jgi:urea transport system substrate-binding protein